MFSMAAYKVGPKIEVNTFECAIVHSMDKEYGKRLEYIQPFWARATIEIQIKLGGYDDAILALINHGSQINIMSRHVYEKEKWPIETHYNWIMKVANCEQIQLYGACLVVLAKIVDMKV